MIEVLAGLYISLYFVAVTAGALWLIYRAVRMDIEQHRREIERRSKQ